MTDRPAEQAALDEGLVAARTLVRVVTLLADEPPPQPDERRRLLSQWATLVGQLDEARLELDRPGAT